MKQWQTVLRSNSTSISSRCTKCSPRSSYPFPSSQKSSTLYDARLRCPNGRMQQSCKTLTGRILSSGGKNRSMETTLTCDFSSTFKGCGLTTTWKDKSGRHIFPCWVSSKCMAIRSQSDRALSTQINLE